MKLYPIEEETVESWRNEAPRVPSINQSVDSLQSRHFVHSFGELDLTEENMDFLFLIVYDQSYRRHYVPEFVSRSNDTMVVLCDFFNCGGTTGTDEWFCYGIPGKDITLKDFKDYASLMEESCRYYFLIEVKNAPKGSNICFKELEDDDELVPFCRNTIIAIVKPE